MTKRSGRYLAQLVLDQVVGGQAYANLALNEVLNRNPEVEPRERAFCTELVYGVLRHLLKIDYFLGRLLSRPLSSLKVSPQNILRLAMYQLLYLTAIPERAVCHAAVEQVKHSKYGGLAPLINGVLRNYLRQKGQLPFPKREDDLLAFLTLEYSHPEWLVKRWLAYFGPSRTEEMLAANNLPAPLTLRVNPLRESPAAAVTDLAARGISVSPGCFLPEALRIGDLSLSIETIPLFQQGAFFIQDESAMLVSHLMQPQPAELLLDLCAAPGGKSTHLAELMGDRGKIVSVDNHHHKIDLIAANASRLGLKSITPVFGDARNFQLPEGELADGILVDAPCSGTGVLRRRADARYRRKPEEIADLAQMQLGILENAATLVRPGGRLVYSTCTLEPEENQLQIEAFLQRHPEFTLDDFRTYLPEAVLTYQAFPDAPWLTILPNPEAGDGFFMCRMQKR